MVIGTERTLADLSAQFWIFTSGAAVRSLGEPGTVICAEMSRGLQGDEAENSWRRTTGKKNKKNEQHQS